DRVALLAARRALAPAGVWSRRGAGGEPARPLQPRLPAQLRRGLGDLRRRTAPAGSARPSGGRVGGLHARDDADRLVAFRPAGAALGAREPARVAGGRPAAGLRARGDRARIRRSAAGGAAAVDRRPAGRLPALGCAAVLVAMGPGPTGPGPI